MLKNTQLQILPSQASDEALLKNHIAEVNGVAASAITGFNIIKKIN